MNDTWLIIDGDNLAHRTFYGMKEFKYANSATTLAYKLDFRPGLIYNFLLRINELMEQYNTDNIVFCFDCGASIREVMFPDYQYMRKLKWRAEPKKKRILHDELKKQITLMHEEYLLSIGFQNVIAQTGYEADDHIASLVKHTIPSYSEIIIVSSDKDLYQLLDVNVKLKLPKQEYTMQTFWREFQIKPYHWPYVKALAGCTSDSIPGIPGVGEIKAAQFDRGVLNKKSKAYASIKANMDIFDRNLPLVTLPLHGTCKVRHEDLHIGCAKVTNERWNKFVKRIGIKELIGLLPIKPTRRIVRR